MIRSGRFCRSVWLSLAFACVVTGVSGCGSSDAELNAQRDRFLIEDAPDDPSSIAEAIVASQESPSDVTLIGRIDAGDQEPFAEGSAAFIITEAPDGSHLNDPNHDPDDCPFCKRRNGEGPIAFVRFEDEEGKLLKTDARELFDLTKGHVVVIKGVGEYSEDLDRFTITAEGLHVMN